MAKKFGPYNYEKKLGERNYNFETQIDKIIINSEARLLAVVRSAIGGVIEDAQNTKAKGGKMPVDTGFLRNTGVAQIGQIPSGPTRGRARKPGEVGVLPEYAYDEQNGPLNIILAKLKIGDVFYFGWTAEYAKIREAYDGFLESALQNWQRHVDTAVNKFRNR